MYYTNRDSLGQFYYNDFIFDELFYFNVDKILGSERSRKASFECFLDEVPQTTGGGYEMGKGYE